MKPAGGVRGATDSAGREGELAALLGRQPLPAGACGGPPRRDLELAQQEHQKRDCKITTWGFLSLEDLLLPIEHSTSGALGAGWLLWVRAKSR